MKKAATILFAVFAAEPHRVAQALSISESGAKPISVQRLPTGRVKLGARSRKAAHEKKALVFEPATNESSFDVKFELVNVNYDDLEKKVRVPASYSNGRHASVSVSLPRAHSTGTSLMSEGDVAEKHFREVFVADILQAAIRDVLITTVESGLTPAGNKTSATSSFPFGESSVDLALMQRNTLGASPSPAVAPAPAPASPTPAQASVATPIDVDVFVEFQPGHDRAILSADDIEIHHHSAHRPRPLEYPAPVYGKMILRHANPPQNVTHGHTTKVTVSITDTAGAKDLKRVARIVEAANSSGELGEAFESSILQAVGVRTRIIDWSFAEAAVPHWSVSSCETHMAAVVKRFVVAYTRRMVPTAIFNECTNFVTAMSFSRDFRPSALDVDRCRRATVKFALRWNFGKGDQLEAANASEEGEEGMSSFCVDMCYAKYGEFSPRCNSAADKLQNATA